MTSYKNGSLATLIVGGDGFTRRDGGGWSARRWDGSHYVGVGPGVQSAAIVPPH